MSTFHSYQLPITQLGNPFTLNLPVNRAYLGVVYQGNIPYLIVEDLVAVTPGPTQPRTLQWVAEGLTYPTGWDELYPAFFSGSAYLLMIQGIR